MAHLEDEWTSKFTESKIVYGQAFLLALRDFPASKIKPENIPEAIQIGNPCFQSYLMGGTHEFLGPSSQAASTNKKRKDRSTKSKKTPFSKVEVVKLHEAENPWKPARFNKMNHLTNEERKTEEICKKVRGILNKVTPQKFETLISQFRKLKIDTSDLLLDVVDLIFNKAVREPLYSVTYAYMCKELALIEVPASGSVDDKDMKDVVNFGKLLITRCQIEFEKQSLDESVRNEKVKEINDCTDPEQKKVLQFEIEEYDRKLRMKSLGNIQFIGELFKQQMLRVNIMMRCLDNLLENQEEESLECLCKLLTTIGKELESRKIDLSVIFNAMKELAEKKNGKVTNKVRFILQDVIDLRNNKWVPRRPHCKPKTIDQIQKEAENEQLLIAMGRKRRNIFDGDEPETKPPQTRAPLDSREIFANWINGTIKEDGIYSNDGSMDRSRRDISDENSLTSFVRLRNRTQLLLGKHTMQTFSLGNITLRDKSPQTDEPLDSRQMFDNWLKGTKKEDRIYNSDGIMDGSRTQLVEGKPLGNKYSQTLTPRYHMTEEQIENYVKLNFDNYLNGTQTTEEYGQDVCAIVPPSYWPTLVTDGYIHVLEKSMPMRIKTGILFAKLIKSGILPLQDYCAGLEVLLDQAEDLLDTIPSFWSYLSEMLVHLITKRALSFNGLHKCCTTITESGLGSELLSSLFNLITIVKGPDFLSKSWRDSGLALADFMDVNQVDNFIQDNKLEFLFHGDIASSQSQLTFEQIHNKLLEFFSVRTAFDDVVNWITANVDERVNENMFIRTLATAIFENSISRQKLVTEALQGHYKLLQKYVSDDQNYELQCLHALQALIHKLEHPKGLLLSICDRLYEDTVISHDTFIAWEICDDPAEQEGKGVALKQLASFFTQLKEKEEEYWSSSDEA